MKQGEGLDALHNEFIWGRVLDCELTFKCPQTWTSLQPTESDRVRFCPECQKRVLFCSTPRQVEKAVAKKECLAFWSGAGDPETGQVRVELGRMDAPPWRFEAK